MNLESYHVFSQLRPDHLIPDEGPELIEPELIELEGVVSSDNYIDHEAFSF